MGGYEGGRADETDCARVGLMGGVAVHNVVAVCRMRGGEEHDADHKSQNAKKCAQSLHAKRRIAPDMRVAQP